MKLSWPVIIGLRGHKVQTFPSPLPLPSPGPLQRLMGIRCPETGEEDVALESGEKQFDWATIIHTYQEILISLGQWCPCFLAKLANLS